MPNTETETDVPEPEPVFDARDLHQMFQLLHQCELLHAKFTDRLRARPPKIDRYMHRDFERETLVSQLVQMGSALRQARRETVVLAAESGFVISITEPLIVPKSDSK